MKIKVTKENCTGCRLCLQICTIEHFAEVNPKKAAIRVYGEFPEPGIFTPKLCVQCGACARACPVDAIERREDKVYVINPETCTNCGICVEACPFDVMFTHPDAPTPIKCDMCLKCTEVCNTGALTAVEDHALETAADKSTN
ncbi:4Fe-4S dicluster domain-containing protein [bacterium]|nr:4Fe-4S dicluster domain-containing protein [bacterium]